MMAVRSHRVSDAAAVLQTRESKMGNPILAKKS